VLNKNGKMAFNPKKEMMDFITMSVINIGKKTPLFIL
jgi:hypothetical protein